MWTPWYLYGIHMTEEQFLTTRNGARFAQIVHDPAMIDQMIAASRKERTPIEALDPIVATAIGKMTNGEKTAAGRVVKAVLRDRGWVPWKKNSRVRGGRVFSRGTVYREIASIPTEPAASAAVASAAPASDRYQAAIDILRAARRPGTTPATVDDFLAERRRMWGDE